MLLLILSSFPLFCNDFVLAQQPKAGNESATEIAFWNSVKDSQDPEEIKAYLAAFPEGMFASLARIRLGKLEQNRQSSASAPKAPSAQLDESTIREVQERLYNLNYGITAINGRLTAELTEAIRVFQGKLGEAITGELTEAQVANLRRIEPPKKWGAIGRLKNGHVETASQKTTRREAEASVLLRCNAAGISDCKIFTVAGQQCAAVASIREVSSDGKIAVRVTISRQNGMEPAQIAALAVCNKEPKSQGRCQIVGKVCADGSHVSRTNPQRDGAHFGMLRQASSPMLSPPQ